MAVRNGNSMTKFVLIHQSATRHVDVDRRFAVRVPDDFSEARLQEDATLRTFLNDNGPDWEESDDEGEIETCITDVHGEITEREAHEMDVIDLTEFRQTGIAG